MEIEKLKLTSVSISEEQKEKLKSLFPEVFTEGNKIDWDKLRLTLGEAVDVGKERFGMNWPGKSECFKTIQQSSIGTLLPKKDESINFETTQNIFIEGDNLEVLRLLQKSYLNKIKMIYIDPPYNTGNDFIYPDNFSETIQTYLEYTGQLDSSGRKFNTNTEAEGRFHSKWMNMMYPRLFLARNLLKDDGVIFISIDDKEQSNLKYLCNEIFGEENFIAQMIWKNVTDNNPTLVNIEHEYIFVYGKNRKSLPEVWKSSISDAKENLERRFTELKNQGIALSSIEQQIKIFIKDNEESLGFLTRYKFVDQDGIYTGSESVHNPKPGGYDFEVLHPETKRPMKKPSNGYRFPESTFLDMVKEGIILFGEDENRIVKIKKYLKDYEETLRSVVTLDGRLGTYDVKRIFETNAKLFDNPKPVDLIKSLISFATNDDDTILDFFAGSGTTASSVIELNASTGSNRKFLCVQLPEPLDEKSEGYKLGHKTISDLAKDRIGRSVKRISKMEDQPVQLRLGESDGKGKTKNLGFRSFRLASSNFKIWDSEIGKDSEIIQHALFDHVDHISPDSKQESILFELLLKSGFELTTPINQFSFEDKVIYSIAEGQLLICLEKELTNQLIKEMADRQPSRVICLDEGFQNNDQLKTNAVQIMKSKGVLNFRTV